MKFAKEFPELSKRTWAITAFTPVEVGDKDLAGTIEAKSAYVFEEEGITLKELEECVLTGDVKKSCLSKQRVKKALKLVFLKKRDEDYMQFQEKIKEGIAKKLGLD